MENKVYFCGGERCCPSIEFKEEKVVIEDEGKILGSLSKKQFKDLVEASKNGKFDKYV